MYWYAAEPLAEVDAQRALALALDGRIPLAASFMVRRVAVKGSPDALASVVETIIERDDKSATRRLSQG